MASPPPVDSDPGIWVTQSLALIREDNKKMTSTTSRVVATVVLNTMLKLQHSPAFPIFGDALRVSGVALKVKKLL